MKRKLDLSQVIKNFEGKPFKETIDKSPNLTLRFVILTYLKSAQWMGLTDNEQTIAYETGIFVAVSLGKTIFTTAQYDVIKKLADGGKIERQEQSDYVYNLEVRLQAKEMIDSAQTIKNKTKGKHAKTKKSGDTKD